MAFAFGALTGNVDLCLKAIESHSHEDEGGWPDWTQEVALGCREGELFEIGSMPYAYLCCLPPEFQFALIRASSGGYYPGSIGFVSHFCQALKAALEAEG